MSLDLQPALRLFRETLMFLLLCFVTVFIETNVACREISSKLTRLKWGKEQQWNINPDMSRCKEIPSSFSFWSNERSWNNLTVVESDAEVTAIVVRDRKLATKYLFQPDHVNLDSWAPLGVLLDQGAEPTQGGYTALNSWGVCSPMPSGHEPAYFGRCMLQEQWDISYRRYFGCLAEPGKLLV